jgi:hypothetical protein
MQVALPKRKHSSARERASGERAQRLAIGIGPAARAAEALAVHVLFKGIIGRFDARA